MIAAYHWCYGGDSSSTQSTTGAASLIVAERDGTAKERRQFGEQWPEISFDLIGRPLQEVCEIQTVVAIDIPDYAPMHKDVRCADCGEQVMVPKAVQQGDGTFCIACAGTEYL